jgi:alpha-galactosidase
MTRKQFNVNGKLVSLSDLGYKYVDIDDVWQGYRAPNGLAPASNFPDMPGLVKYIHRLGLKIGLYTSAGTVSCVANRPGSGGYEAVDGQEFRRWGIDLLKVDWCGQNIQLSPSWVEMEAEKWRSALGPNIILSLSTEGRGAPWSWAQSDNTANMWRVSHDTQDAWNTAPGSVVQILDNSFVGLSSSSPQHWSDLDFLEVGVHNLTLDESESQFSLWALVGSPLLLGNDVTQMNGQDIASQVAINSEVISVDQDPHVVQGTRKVSDTAQNTEIWVKPLTGDRYAVVMLNKNTNKSVRMRAVWSQLGITDYEAVRDVWAHKDMGTHMSSYSAEVEPGGVVMIIASPLNSAIAFNQIYAKTLLFALPMQMPAAVMPTTDHRTRIARR